MVDIETARRGIYFKSGLKFWETANSFGSLSYPVGLLNSDHIARKGFRVKPQELFLYSGDLSVQSLCASKNFVNRDEAIFISTSSSKDSEVGAVLQKNSSSKRALMSDYKPFSAAFSLTNIVSQASKALLLSGSGLLLEYNRHLDVALRNAQKLDDIKAARAKGLVSIVELRKHERELSASLEFNWTASLSKYSPLFGLNFTKLYLGSIVKKVYELGVVSTCPSKLADKLTKDLSKSYARKISRIFVYGSYKSLATRVFNTALNCNFFNYLSVLTVDVFVEIVSSLYHYLYPKVGSKGRDVSKSKGYLTYFRVITVWFSKKVIVVSLGLCGSAAGYATGGYLGYSLMSASIWANLFDLLATSVTISLLGL